MNVTRALSLTQPWATLVAIGAKKFETRDWRTHDTGWIAIHASKKFPQECRDLCTIAPFNRALALAGVKCAEDLPRGMVIAVVHVTKCVSTDEWKPAPESEEYHFGNYGPKRWAWQLENPLLIVPFAARGALSIWQLERAITKADLR